LPEGQRIALARAVVRQPSVLLLDEASSHLDALTEARVDANVVALACTRIVIAHRLSTIRDADLILLVEAGRIVERGTHAQLMARGGQCAALVRGQVEDSAGRHES
jgi:ABC-type bacteriocin/lantibiotic exporter with double-glycine peptidase domain